MSRRRWTEYEDNRLRALRRADVSIADMVAHFDGRSEAAIQWRLSKIGAGISRQAAKSPKRAWSQEDDATLARLWREDASAADIAAALGRPVAAVRFRLGKLGLRKHRKVRAGRDEKALPTLTSQAAVKSYAKRTRRTLKSVRNQLARLGVRYIDLPAYPPPVDAPWPAELREPESAPGGRWARVISSRPVDKLAALATQYGKGEFHAADGETDGPAQA